MDDEQIKQRLQGIFDANDMEAFAKAQHEMAADDIMVEYPQSAERFRGRERIAKMNQNYPASTGTAPSLTLRRILKPGEAWVIESVIDYGDGTPVSGISIIETNSDGKVARQTDYFANPFEAPAWRAEYAEQIERAGSR